VRRVRVLSLGALVASHLVAVGNARADDDVPAGDKVKLTVTADDARVLVERRVNE
jgi:hypothetical protein